MVGHVPLEDGIGVRVPAPQLFQKIAIWYDAEVTQCLKL